MSVISKETQSGVETLQFFEADNIDLLMFGKETQSAVLCGQFVLSHEGEIFDINDQHKPDEGKTITLTHDVKDDEEVIWQATSVDRGVAFGDKNFTSTVTVLDGRGARGFTKKLDNAGGARGGIKSGGEWVPIAEWEVAQNIDFIASLLDSGVFAQQVASKRAAIEKFSEKKGELEAEIKDGATPKKLKEVKRMGQQVTKLGFPDTQLYPAFTMD